VGFSGWWAYQFLAAFLYATGPTGLSVMIYPRQSLPTRFHRNEAKFATPDSENIQRTSPPNPQAAGGRFGLLALQQESSG
jgi:hypothetical protein